MKLDITDKKIILSFSYNKALIAKCKTPGLEMKWQPSTKTWWLPNNLMNRRLFAQVFEGIYEIPEPAPVFNNYLPPSYLMQHQKEAVLFGKTCPRHLFAHATGTGKTCIAIELIRQLRNGQSPSKTLVVCPLSIIEPAWMSDLKQFAPELKAVNLWRNWKRSIADFKRWIEWMNVGIINFESFKKSEKYFDGIKMVIIDESSKIKNMQAAITKAMVSFCDDIEYAYLFSGTPAPNNEMEYFSQARIIDPTILGKSFYKFREKYFYNIPSCFKWIKRNDTDLLDKIAQFSSVVKKEDVLDLPERTFNTIDVMLSPAEKTAYRDMINHLVAIIEDEEISAFNAAVKCMKLRQVTSGFLINENSEVRVFGKSKLNALAELLEEIGNQSIIIWTQFVHEAKQIQELLKDKSVGIINGSSKQADKDNWIKDFKAGSVQYLIAHPLSMAHGVTLTNCTYSIYYSLSYSHEEHVQSRDRIYRKGTTKPCTYYYLMAPGTIDTVIYNILQGKQKAELAVLNYVKHARDADKMWGG